MVSGEDQYVCSQRQKVVKCQVHHSAQKMCTAPESEEPEAKGGFCRERKTQEILHLATGDAHTAARTRLSKRLDTSESRWMTLSVPRGKSSSFHKCWALLRSHVAVADVLEHAPIAEPVV